MIYYINSSRARKIKWLWLWMLIFSFLVQSWMLIYLLFYFYNFASAAWGNIQHILSESIHISDIKIMSPNEPHLQLSETEVACFSARADHESRHEQSLQRTIEGSDFNCPKILTFISRKTITIFQAGGKQPKFYVGHLLHNGYTRCAWVYPRAPSLVRIVCLNIKTVMLQVLDA